MIEFTILTVPLEPKDFVVLCSLILGVSAFYGISVRPFAGLPRAFNAAKSLQ